MCYCFVFVFISVWKWEITSSYLFLIKKNEKKTLWHFLIILIFLFCVLLFGKYFLSLFYSLVEVRNSLSLLWCRGHGRRLGPARHLVPGVIRGVVVEARPPDTCAGRVEGSTSCTNGGSGASWHRRVVTQIFAATRSFGLFF